MRSALFVLTSKGTFSGGEEFAYDVKAFKRGLVVGETTRPKGIKAKKPWSRSAKRVGLAPPPVWNSPEV